MEDQFKLRFYGKEADMGRMDYYDVSAAILAFGDFLGIAARAEYGDEVRIRTSVSAPTDGSLTLQFWMTTGGILATVISGPLSPKDFWNLVKGAIDCYKFLRGNAPSKVETKDGKVTFTNIDGDVAEFNQTINVILNNPKSGPAVERFVRAPLRDAASYVDIASQNASDSVSISDQDADSYTDVSGSAIVTDETVRISLAIETAAFVEGNKWRLSDGEQHFSAEIEDEKFLLDIDQGESFSKGDVLVVECHILQEMIGGKLKTTRTVRKVHKHLRPPESGDMFEG